MPFVDYYKILGIAKTATPDDIKKAYRKLARKYHPDLNPNNKDAKKNFQEINEANEALSDTEKRKKYDEYASNWQENQEFEKTRSQQQTSGNARGSRFSGDNSEGDFSDFFESMFGRAAGTGRSAQAKYRGQDYQTELHLNLADVFKSHKQTLTVNGQKIRITIPAGVENGQTIKITGHGGEGRNGGLAGDLYLTFQVALHPKFQRLNDNLFTTIDLDLYTALLGGEITLETLNGKVLLKVKPETQNGSKVKLKGKGVPVYKNEGAFGDLFITYSIKMPTNLSERQKELFTELSKM